MPGKTDARKELGDHTRQQLLQAARRVAGEQAWGRGPALRRQRRGGGEHRASQLPFRQPGEPGEHRGPRGSGRRLSGQAERLAVLPPDAALEDIVAAWIRPTIHGLQEDREAGALPRIASRAITEAPADLREWAQDIMERPRAAHR